MADFLNDLAAPNTRLVSIGCGLGFIEANVWSRRNRDLEIHVQDFSEKALKCFFEEKPAYDIHGKDWPHGEEFEVIYLGTIDYALDDISLVSLLK